MTIDHPRHPVDRMRVNDHTVVGIRRYYRGDGS
jgi:hypothetical protein